MEDKLQDEFMEFWDSKKDILGLGNYSDAVLKFWVDKIPNSQLIAKQVEEIIESTVKLERQTLRDKIGGMKKSSDKHLEYDPATKERRAYVDGYYVALDSVLALIDEKKN